MEAPASRRNPTISLLRALERGVLGSQLPRDLTCRSQLPAIPRAVVPVFFDMQPAFQLLRPKPPTVDMSFSRIAPVTFDRVNVALKRIVPPPLLPATPSFLPQQPPPLRDTAVQLADHDVVLSDTSVQLCDTYVDLHPMKVNQRLPLDHNR